MSLCRPCCSLEKDFQQETASSRQRRVEPRPRDRTAVLGPVDPQTPLHEDALAFAITQASVAAKVNRAAKRFRRAGERKEPSQQDPERPQMHATSPAGGTPRSSSSSSSSAAKRDAGNVREQAGRQVKLNSAKGDSQTPAMQRVKPAARPGAKSLLALDPLWFREMQQQGAPEHVLQAVQRALDRSKELLKM